MRTLCDTYHKEFESHYRSILDISERLTSVIWKSRVFFTYIPGCSEEQDHSSQQITQKNLHLKYKAKQQQRNEIIIT